MRLGLINTLMSPLLSQNVSDLRVQISDTSFEAVTGRYSDLTTHLDGKIGDAMLTQKALEDIGREQTEIDLRLSRLEITQQSLETIQEAGSGVGLNVLGAIATGDLEEVQVGGQDAKIALRKIFSALGAKLGPRHLFSGDATANGPLQPMENLIADVEAILSASVDETDFQTNIDAYFDDPAGGWQTTIYTGTATTSDPNGVLAIDPAITQLVKGLSTLALADDSSNHPIISGSQTVLSTASQTITTATDSVIDLRVETGRNQEVFEERQNVLVAENRVLTQTFNDLTARDQFEAATELRQLENSLEASYLITSRLSNLTLLNYLR